MVTRVEIVTSGDLIHSPYPERRRFNIKVASNLKRPLSWVETIAEELDGMTPPLPPLREYALSFCKYCRERGELCLRHRSIEEVPIGNESNLDYYYSFERYSGHNGSFIIKVHFELGTGWVVDGAIVYAPGELKSGAFRVVRPSGKAFTYRLKPGKPSSAWYIIDKIASFLWRVVKASYISIEMAKE